jgi:hypothetical protein
MYLDCDSKALVNAKPWNGKIAGDVTAVTQTLFRFCLLDRLMDAFQLPVFQTLNVVKRQDFPEMSGRFGDRVSIFCLIHTFYLIHGYTLYLVSQRVE